jgi:integrase
MSCRWVKKTTKGKTFRIIEMNDDMRNILSLRHTCLTNLANGYGMDAPLPLPHVQKIAGHKDIATTMRYVHVDGIENTTSRQWSREQRKAFKERDAVPPKATSPFRVIIGGLS